MNDLAEPVVQSVGAAEEARLTTAEVAHLKLGEFFDNLVKREVIDVKNHDVLAAQLSQKATEIAEGLLDKEARDLRAALQEMSNSALIWKVRFETAENLFLKNLSRVMSKKVKLMSLILKKQLIGHMKQI